MPAARISKKPKITIPKTFLQVAANGCSLPKRPRKPLSKKVTKRATGKFTPASRGPRKIPKRNGGITKKKKAIRRPAAGGNPTVKRSLHKGATFSSYEDFVNALYKYQRETNTVFKTVKKNYLAKEDHLRKTLRYADHTYQCGHIQTVTTAGAAETAVIKSKPCMVKIEVNIPVQLSVLSSTELIFWKFVIFHRHFQSVFSIRIL